MKRTSARIGRMSSIGTNGNQTSQYQDSTASGVGFSILAFPSMFWRPVRYEVEHSHARELFCRVFAIVAVFLSIFGSNASTEVDTVPM